MPPPPLGTIALVFTDIQGSCELWETDRDAFRLVLEEHNRLIREAAARWDGYEVKTEGDAFFLTFTRAADAIRFATRSAPWESSIGPIHPPFRPGCGCGWGSTRVPRRR
jgi:class 3 adenylate cyclase